MSDEAETIRWFIAHQCLLVSDEAEAFLAGITLDITAIVVGVCDASCLASSATRRSHIHQELIVILTSDHFRVIELLLRARVCILVLHGFSLRRFRVGSPSRLFILLPQGSLLFFIFRKRRWIAFIEGLRPWLLFHKLLELLMRLTYLSVSVVEFLVDTVSWNADSTLEQTRWLPLLDSRCCGGLTLVTTS